MAKKENTAPTGSNHKSESKKSIKDIAIAFAPLAFLVIVALAGIYKFVDPAPPKKFTISTGEESGNAYEFAKQYREAIKEDHIDLEIMPSKGAWENMSRLEDPHSGVSVGFIQDGLGTREKNPGVTSLGSLYYEPVWVFTHGKLDITRFNQLRGKRVGMGEKGGETHTMAKKLLMAGGVDVSNAQLLDMDTEKEVQGLQDGSLDAAFFIGRAENAVIHDLLKNPNLHLMNVDQAEAITRQFPYLHHLILPHGTLDLDKNIPSHDINLVGSTATLVVRKDIHPALVYLLLKAAQKVHHTAGIFEQKHEFPIDKDYVFPLNAEAKNFYKSGAPFWKRYLPFWLATIVERFIYLFIPLMALIVPVIRLIPRYFTWRARSRIFQRYGELKMLENQITPHAGVDRYLGFVKELDGIEERVNSMNIPLDFSDYVYVLREHIHFVRERLNRQLLRAEEKEQTHAHP